MDCNGFKGFINQWCSNITLKYNISTMRNILNSLCLLLCLIAATPCSGVPPWLKTLSSIDEIRTALATDSSQINAYNEYGLTGLLVAASITDVAKVGLLLQHGAYVNASSANTSNTMSYARATALHMICRSSNFGPREMAILDLLLAYKADVNVHDADGRTPLYYICGIINDSSIRNEVLKKLLAHGAQFWVQDIYGNTPLHFYIDILRTDTSFLGYIFNNYSHMLPRDLFFIKNKNKQNLVEFARARGYVSVVKILCPMSQGACTSSDKRGVLGISSF